MDKWKFSFKLAIKFHKIFDHVWNFPTFSRAWMADLDSSSKVDTDGQRNLRTTKIAGNLSGQPSKIYRNLVWTWKTIFSCEMKILRIWHLLEGSMILHLGVGEFQKWTKIIVQKNCNGAFAKFLHSENLHRNCECLPEI